MIMKHTIAITILITWHRCWIQASSATPLTPKPKKAAPRSIKSRSYKIRRRSNGEAFPCFLFNNVVRSRRQWIRRPIYYPTSSKQKEWIPDCPHYCRHHSSLSTAASRGPNVIIEEETSSRHAKKPTNTPGARRAKKKKTKKEKKGGTHDQSWQMKKSEINDLVRGIGLEPVVAQRPAQHSQKKKNAPTSGAATLSNSDGRSVPQHNNADPWSFLHPQSPPAAAIPLQTQLNFARHGHAVLPAFLPRALVRQLRAELLPHAAAHALSAWRQKVEVQLAAGADGRRRTNARARAAGLRSVGECRGILEGLGVDPAAGDLPFLQHFNAWRTCSRTAATSRAVNTNPPATVRKLCLSSHLARTASVLLDAPTIRLYQDALFHKRVGDGFTPWHSDARMAPFDTSRMVTFWIPLRRVPSLEEGGTGLQFASGSQADFALPYWNEAGGPEYARLEQRYGGGGSESGVGHHMPLEVGDVTVHSGWTLHCSEAAVVTEEGEDGREDRYAFAVTYVDGRAELREDVLASSEIMDRRHTEGRDAIDGRSHPPTFKGDDEDVWSFRSWVEEVEPRTEFRHPMVPIVWPPEQREDVE